MIAGHAGHIRDLRKLAATGRLGHAYLFWGAERIGKKTVARAFGNFLENGAFERAPENVALRDCLAISPDADRIIGIDAVRALKYFLWQMPIASPRRLAIIDRAERLTPQAQDALLKITENPPPESLIILVAVSPDLLKPTLTSRFQALYFSPVAESDIARLLVGEGVPNTDAKRIAAYALGAPGLAHARAFDSAFSAREKEIRDLFSRGGASRAALMKDIIGQEDFDFEELLDGMIRYVTEAKHFSRWHDLLALRRDASFFNVSPRIQLEAFFAAQTDA